MGTKLSTIDLVVGIVLIVVGVLVVVGRLSIPLLGTITAILLIVAGIAALIGKIKGGLILGLVLIGLGVLLLVFDPALQAVDRVLDTVVTLVVGVGLIVLGALKLVGKW